MYSHTHIYIERTIKRAKPTKFVQFQDKQSRSCCIEQIKWLVYMQIDFCVRVCMIFISDWTPQMKLNSILPLKLKNFICFVLSFYFILWLVVLIDKIWMENFQILLLNNVQLHKWHLFLFIIIFGKSVFTSLSDKESQILWNLKFISERLFKQQPHQQRKFRRKNLNNYMNENRLIACSSFVEGNIHTVFGRR